MDREKRGRKKDDKVKVLSSVVKIDIKGQQRRKSMGEEEEGEIDDGSEDEVGETPRELPDIKRYWGEDSVSFSSKSRTRYYEEDEEKNKRSTRRRESSPSGNSRDRRVRSPGGNSMDKRERSPDEKPRGRRERSSVEKPRDRRERFLDEKPKGRRDRSPDEKPRGRRERFPDEKPRGRRERFPDEKPRGRRERFPDEKPRGRRERSPDEKPRGKRERSPNEKPRSRGERSPDEKPRGGRERSPSGNSGDSREMSPEDKPRDRREGSSDEKPRGRRERSPGDNFRYRRGRSLDGDSKDKRERSPDGKSRGRGRGGDLRDELDAMEKGELTVTDKRPPRRGRQDDDKDEPHMKRRRNDGVEKADKPLDPPEEIKRKPQLDEVLTRTGGAYIPPAKLRMMQKDLTDKSSLTYQRIAWEALKKSINGLINKVNTSNVGIIVRELFKENLVRGRGVLCRSIMQAQSASPTFTNVYAALVAIINTKFPNIGELILKRLIIQFRRGYTRNDKPACLAAASFIGHLVNQQVAHEVLALEILTLLLEHPTEDSVQVAIAFLKEVGARIDEVSPKGAHYIFERLRNVLNEATLDKRVQYMIEVMFQVRKDKFKDFLSVPEDLDLVEEEEQFTHLVTLDEATDGQDILNVFKADTDYLVNEEKYLSLRKEILDESENDEDEDEEEEDVEGEDGEGGEVPDSGTILDRTETNLLGLRKTIYLTIQSSLDFEECCHKLLKMNMQDGQEIELCHMILDCCAQQRTYEKFFGLLAGRFCSINMKYVSPFEAIFKDTYDTVHRLDTNKLRNVSKFFAHLLFTDSFSWGVLQCIRLTEDDTTSSSRIFVKILFQELSEYMGLNKLNERITDPSLSYCFDGLFPRDHPKNTRFAINFFTSIGLGGLTDELREHLKKHPKPTAVVAPQITLAETTVKEESKSSSESSSSSSSSSSSDSDSDSSSTTSSSSSSSARERNMKRRRNVRKK